MIRWFPRYLKILLPSLLVGIFPVLFFYNNNATKLDLNSLLLPVLIMLLVTLVVTGTSALVYKDSPQDALLASVIFLLLFYFYGLVYDRMLRFNRVQIEHATFLPIYIFMTCLAIKIAQRIFRRSNLKLGLGIGVIFGALLLYNLGSIVPVELRKHSTASTAEPVAQAQLSGNTLPDVYYIVVDETASFNAMRTYWHYDGVNTFEDFLKSKGFFVAENSRSKTYDTLVEISNRLNMQDMSGNKDFTEQDWFEAIANNKVMELFKQLGYTTVTLDQVRAPFGYTNKTPIHADVSLTADLEKPRLMAVDEFFYLVFSRSMLRPVSDEISSTSDPLIQEHRKNVLFFFNRLAHLDLVQSPKFVYGQVMLTHYPLIFDQNGDSVPQQYHADWNYYLGSYIYEMKKLTELVDTLLKNADPANPPIIIIQSDHGFRNLQDLPKTVLLQNYPDENRYGIVNAMYLPGYDTSQLPDDLDPIDTFILIFNHYFDLKIPIR